MIFLNAPLYLFHPIFTSLFHSLLQNHPSTSPSPNTKLTRATATWRYRYGALAPISHRWRPSPYDLASLLPSLPNVSSGDVRMVGSISPFFFLFHPKSVSTHKEDEIFNIPISTGYDIFWYNYASIRHKIFT